MTTSTTKPISPITQHFLDRVREGNWWDRLGEFERQFPDLPCGKEMHAPALIWAAMQKDATYHTSDLRGFLIDFHGLSRKQLAYRFKGNGLEAFPNYVAWLTAYWTRPDPCSNKLPPLHEGIGAKRYRLTQAGGYEASELRRALGGTWQDALDRLKTNL